MTDRAVTSNAAATFDPTTIASFTYDCFDLDLAAGRLVCRYRLDDLTFAEEVRFAPAPGADLAAATAAARLVFLLAGISYYKAAAPPVINLGTHALTVNELTMLQAFYADGLGEYAYRNGLDLRALTFRHETAAPSPVRTGVSPTRPLVPFGGGIDSIVTVEAVREHHGDTALFVLSPPGDRFAPIEAAAAVTGLSVLRAERALDPAILRSRELGFRNGHVPVTGILSAIAILVAVLDGRGAVVMANEWSASSGNLTVNGRAVNHQYSKSAAFETLLRGALADAFADGPDYFSLLRATSELAIARTFAALTAYHPVFRSCNRSFHLDVVHRSATWCGTCDKCCFIDLILAPFMPAAALAQVFDGREPLTNTETIATFRTLLELGDAPKPFECVGERGECRAAVQLASARPDRAGQPILTALAKELRDAPVSDAEVDALFAPIGPHHIPQSYAPRHFVG